MMIGADLCLHCVVEHTHLNFSLAFNCLYALYDIIERDPTSLALLPSPIFPSSSPYQQYSGLSFLAAVQKKHRIVFSKLQKNLPTNPSHLPKYLEFTKDDPIVVTRSLDFCCLSFFLQNLLLNATPPIEVDSEIIQELTLCVKQALTTVLANISNIDTLIASLHSDSSPTTLLVSGVETQMIDSLHQLRDDCHDFLDELWRFFVDVTSEITDHRKSSFQQIILDDPSFPDLILNSLKLNHQEIRDNLLRAIRNISISFPLIKEQFMAANLVGRMFETVDFVSLPLSESDTPFQLTIFIASMFIPMGDDEDAQIEQYPRIPKLFITFMFNNSENLFLDEEDRTKLEYNLCWIHHHIKNMDLQSDEHDADFVSELVKWEMRTMVEMENEEHFEYILQSIGNRTKIWRRNKRERQKRREALLREEGWDDAFELRMVGIEVDTNQSIQSDARELRRELRFNADRF
ncbi:hypothetical protein BLNAU_16560 [Blattamonas nauphoetae]|uniref:Uncharacterized protein n=1 Tax=Blattamonas nauphoetae TaxID=2049346 RepID=A0ABQ9XDV2_9EUKA|nr:hypothetical protein BLNAU_16560 [Blattamonas nauphoetae]